MNISRKFVKYVETFGYKSKDYRGYKKNRARLNRIVFNYESLA